MELQPLNQPSVQTIFNRIDEDQDGYITVCQLLRYIRSNVDHKFSKKLIEEVCRISDKDEYRRLDLQQFIALSREPEIQKIVSYMKRGIHGYLNFIVPKHYVRPDSQAVDGAYEDEYTCCPPAVLMIFISLIEIGLYSADLYLMEGGGFYGPIAKETIYDPYRRKECWRFLTYMFVHIGNVHLIVNCIIQILLGVPLEMVHKGGRVVLIYLAGVIAGSLGTSIIEPNVKLAGASGGVYSLLTAHVATIVLNWKEMSYPLVQLLLWLILIGADIGNVIYTQLYLMNASDISYTAHYFGALAGLLVGITVLRNIDVTKGERIVRWIAVVLYIILMGSAIVCNIFLPNHFPKQAV